MTQKIKQAFGGGILGALGAVVLAQKLVAGVQASEDKTLIAVGIGFALGAIAGAVIPAKKPIKAA